MYRSRSLHSLKGGYIGFRVKGFNSLKGVYRDSTGEHYKGH